MTVIILLQLAALSWGIWSAYVAHPSYLVYSSGEFYTVDAGETDVSRVTVPSLTTSMFSHPKTVFALPPKDDAEKAALFTAFLTGKQKDIPYLAERYRPLSEHMKVLLSRADENARNLAANKKKMAVVNAWLRAHGGGMADYAFFTVFGRKNEGVVALHRNNGEPAGYLDLIL